MAKITGSFSGRVKAQTNFALSDATNHDLGIVEVSGPQTTSDPLWSDTTITYWGTADLVAGNGPQRGYWINQHANGDTDWGTFEGKITTSGGQTTMAGTYKWMGGTGKLKGISGGGKYKGRFPSAVEVVNDWEGEYQIAKAKGAK
ncbi:MAG: hypothetical protein HY508_12185 [Acidobacteria bacterium]|nr:hypothetical protein [Acidobacteriota bacterium]